MNRDRPSSKARRPYVRSLRSLLGPSAAIGVLVLSACLVLYFYRVRQEERNCREREMWKVEVASLVLAQELRAALVDLQTLADGAELHDYLTSGRRADLNRAIHRAQFLSRRKSQYDQLRVLDDGGQEILRVDAGGDTITPEQLQNKAGRPYYRKARALSPGQLYISSFDLNVENGRVQQPFKPTLRFVSPVLDDAGQTRGLYVINYLGRSLLDRLHLSVVEDPHRIRVLNGQGYWLVASQSSREWGFLFPERSALTLAEDDRELWSRITTSAAGVANHAGGIFAWRTIVPGLLSVDGSSEVLTEDAFLVIASEVTRDERAVALAKIRHSVLAIGGSVFVLLLAGTWLVRSRRRDRAERDRFFALSRDMFCIARMDGYFETLNPAWEATLGHTIVELMSRPFLEFVHPDDRERTAAETARLATGDETLCFENRYRCNDGSYRWLLWSARPLLEENRIFAAARDITERKAAEEMIRVQNGRIEATNKELEAFSYSVSHDLRAPLRAIDGFGKALLDDYGERLDEGGRDYIGRVRAATQRMGSLIDDLLELSRTSRGEIRRDTVDLSALADRIAGELRDADPDRATTVDVIIARGLIVDGDGQLLGVVLDNLLRNAWKFTSKKPSATIELGSSGSNGDRVFFVRDDGAGFDMAHSKLLFKAFQRLHRRTDFEGTGIGLATAQRIIERHRGSLWAEAAVEQGATFYFTLWEEGRHDGSRTHRTAPDFNEP